jgi:hypothetical protein
MPVFRLQIEKFHSNANEYWVNRYFLNAASLADATLASNGIVDAEKALYMPEITITKSHVDDNAPNTSVFETVIRNLPGTRANVAADRMPLFVVVRVDFTVAGGGRPSRKYLRGILNEGEVSFTTLAAGVVTLVDQYAANVAASGACDPQGQDIIAGVTWKAPAMRQLRRGSKKKLTP